MNPFNPESESNAKALHAARLQSVYRALRELPYADIIQVFGSAAKGKSNPADIDVVVDLRSRDGLTLDALDGLLRIARRHYGLLDPFVITEQGKLLARNDLATGWKAARNGAQLLQSMQGDTVLLARLVLRTHDPVTETSAFQAWFGASKVTDEEGRPLVVYHGTGRDFNAFDPAEAGSNYGLDTRKAFFFAQRLEEAEQAAADAAASQGGAGAEFIMPVYLSLQNPLEVQAREPYSASTWYDMMADPAGTPTWQGDLFRCAHELGHDGVILRSGYVSEATYTAQRDGDATALEVSERRDARIRASDNIFVAFEATQIKSALGNNAQFDPDNPDIRKRDLERPTEETIQKTRQWFADNALACIAEVESGKVRVNDPERYFANKRQDHTDFLAGKYDHTFAFLQRAHYLQTGESVAFLP